MKYLDFYQYLKEAKHGRYWSAYWMDSHGKFYEVYSDEDMQKGHYWFAQMYCIKHDIDFSTTGPQEELFKKRWVRVTFNYHGDKTLRFDYSQGHNPLTNTTQRRALQVKADELAAQSVFDDVRNREVEL